jgi:hypothetical protein
MKAFLQLAKSVKSGDLTIADLIAAKKVQKELARHEIADLGSETTKSDISDSIHAGVDLYATALEAISEALEDEKKVDAIINGAMRLFDIVEKIGEKVEERVAAHMKYKADLADDNRVAAEHEAANA